LTEQRKHNTSFRKNISEHKWLQSRNCSTPYYRKYLVILLADGDGSQQMNNLRKAFKTQKLILLPGVENGFSELSRLSGSLGRLVRM